MSGNNVGSTTAVMWFGGILLTLFFFGLFFALTSNFGLVNFLLILPLGILGGLIFYWTRSKKKSEATDEESTRNQHDD